jgi:hypothetical protein
MNVMYRYRTLSNKAAMTGTAHNQPRMDDLASDWIEDDDLTLMLRGGGALDAPEQIVGGATSVDGFWRCTYDTKQQVAAR